MRYEGPTNLVLNVGLDKLIGSGWILMHVCAHTL